VVACSQLSRAVERRDSKRPRLSDLRESGEIEQTADVVLFLYRKDYYDEEPKPEGEEAHMEDDKNKTAVETEIIIGKQRNGPTDSFPVMFHKIYASFHDLHREPFEAVAEGRPPF